MVLRGLVNLKNIFETLQDCNDSDEKKNLESPILIFQSSQKLCKF